MLSPEKKKVIRRLAYRVRDIVQDIVDTEYEEAMERGDSEYYNCTESLGGMCARASALLSTLLTQAKIKHELAYGDGHVYIECDGYVIDVTATQFGEQYGMTLIRPQFEMQNKELHDTWWRTSKLFKNINHLIRWQKKNSWPEEQMVWAGDFEYL